MPPTTNLKLTHKLVWTALFFGFFIVLFTHTAQADSLLTSNKTPTNLPLWEFGLGTGAISLPTYRGSDVQKSYIYPIPYFVYRGDKLHVDRRGLRRLIFDRGDFSINISAGIGIPVKSDKNSARTGMPNLDTAIHIGPSFEYLINDNLIADSVTVFKFPLQLVVGTDLKSAHSEGWFLYPHINYIRKFDWTLGLALGMTYGTEEFHNYYYGVAPQYTLTSRPAYDAKAGYSGIRGSITFSRRYKKYWAGLFARYEYLKNTAFDDSPLFTQDYSLVIGAGVSWIINSSKK